MQPPSDQLHSGDLRAVEEGSGTSESVAALQIGARVKGWFHRARWVVLRENVQEHVGVTFFRVPMLAQTCRIVQEMLPNAWSKSETVFGMSEWAKHDVMGLCHPQVRVSPLLLPPIMGEDTPLHSLIGGEVDQKGVPIENSADLSSSSHSQVEPWLTSSTAKLEDCWLELEFSPKSQPIPIFDTVVVSQSPSIMKASNLIRSARVSVQSIDGSVNENMLHGSGNRTATCFTAMSSKLASTEQFLQMRPVRMRIVLTKANSSGSNALCLSKVTSAGWVGVFNEQTVNASTLPMPAIFQSHSETFDRSLELCEAVTLYQQVLAAMVKNGDIGSFELKYSVPKYIDALNDEQKHAICALLDLCVTNFGLPVIHCLSVVEEYLISGVQSCINMSAAGLPYDQVLQHAVCTNASRQRKSIRAVVAQLAADMKTRRKHSPLKWSLNVRIDMQRPGVDLPSVIASSTAALSRRRSEASFSILCSLVQRSVGSKIKSAFGEHWVEDSSHNQGVDPFEQLGSQGQPDAPSTCDTGCQAILLPVQLQFEDVICQTELSGEVSQFAEQKSSYEHTDVGCQCLLGEPPENPPKVPEQADSECQVQLLTDPEPVQVPILVHKASQCEEAVESKKEPKPAVHDMHTQTKTLPSMAETSAQCTLEIPRTVVQGVSKASQAIARTKSESVQAKPRSKSEAIQVTFVSKKDTAVTVYTQVGSGLLTTGVSHKPLTKGFSTKQPVLKSNISTAKSPPRPKTSQFKSSNNIADGKSSNWDNKLQANYSPPHTSSAQTSSPSSSHSAPTKQNGWVFSLPQVPSAPQNRRGSASPSNGLSNPRGKHNRQVRDQGVDCAASDDVWQTQKGRVLSHSLAEIRNLEKRVLEDIKDSVAPWGINGDSPSANCGIALAKRLKSMRRELEAEVEHQNPGKVVMKR